MKKALVLLAVIACRDAASVNVTKRAAQIETHLLPAVQVRGEDVGHTIEERMREYKIPAVSIAVFDNYALVWSKAYGLADVEAGTRNAPPHAATRANDHPLFLLEDGHLDEAAAALKRVKDPAGEEAHINLLGYQLLPRDAAKAAQLLRINAVAFPESANAHDSYGEALAKSGKKDMAIAEYERVLAVVDADPRIPAGDKKTFKKHADDELAKLRAK